jgi:hypothetical protein
MSCLTVDIVAGEIGAALAVSLSLIARTHCLILRWRRPTREEAIAFATLAEGGQYMAAETLELTYRAARAPGRVL